VLKEAEGTSDSDQEKLRELTPNRG
jgi:hypothetical protein